MMLLSDSRQQQQEEEKSQMKFTAESSTGKEKQTEQL